MIRALNNLLSKFNKEKARAVWQPLRNIHKSYISIILMKSKRLKKSVRQVVKSAVENYRVYLTQTSNSFCSEEKISMQNFIDEKGNEKTYAEAILDRF